MIARWIDGQDVIRRKPVGGGVNGETGADCNSFVLAIIGGRDSLLRLGLTCRIEKRNKPRVLASIDQPLDVTVYFDRHLASTQMGKQQGTDRVE